MLVIRKDEKNLLAFLGIQANSALAISLLENLTLQRFKLHGPSTEQLTLHVRFTSFMNCLVFLLGFLVLRLFCLRSLMLIPCRHVRATAFTITTIIIGMHFSQCVEHSCRRKLLGAKACRCFTVTSARTLLYLLALNSQTLLALGLASAGHRLQTL